LYTKNSATKAIAAIFIASLLAILAASTQVAEAAAFSIKNSPASSSVQIDFRDLSAIMEKYGYYRSGGKAEMFKRGSSILVIENSEKRVTFAEVDKALKSAKASRETRLAVFSGIKSSVAESIGRDDKLELKVVTAAIESAGFKPLLTKRLAFTKGTETAYVTVKANDSVTYESLSDELKLAGIDSGTRAKILKLTGMVYHGVNPRYSRPQLLEEATFRDLVWSLSESGFEAEKTSQRTFRFTDSSNNVIELSKSDSSNLSRALTQSVLDRILASATHNGTKNPLRGSAARTVIRLVNKRILKRMGVNTKLPVEL